MLGPFATASRRTPMSTTTTTTTTTTTRDRGNRYGLIEWAQQVPILKDSQDGGNTDMCIAIHQMAAVSRSNFLLSRLPVHLSTCILSLFRYPGFQPINLQLRPTSLQTTDCLIKCSYLYFIAQATDVHDVPLVSTVSTLNS